MNTEEIYSFKKQLMEIKESTIDFEDKEIYEQYADKMLLLIGNTDPELRDELIYEILVKWMEENRLSEEYLKKMLYICMDNEHLLYRIDDQIPESVFTRSFSALMLGCILELNLNSGFLSKKEVTKVLETMVNYYNAEKDYRGYTGKMGWAHSMAHGADVFAVLAMHKELKKEEIQKILDIFIPKICQGEYVFIDKEQDRMIIAIMQIFNRKEFSDEEIIQWIMRFKNHEKDRMSAFYYHERVNIENFFRGLYFQAKAAGISEYILAKIEEKVM